jgi:hypothetical protein
MSEFLSSSELFINIKNPPRWNPKKNYFDQSIDVLDFYLEEKKKLTEGITIGGYYIHPLMYWHINYFKTPLPTSDKQEVITNPPLDDNFLYFMETYQEAEEKNLGVGLFGTRGATKTSVICSLTSFLNSTKPNGTTSIIGGNQGDLSNISKLLAVAFNNVNPAFFIPQLISDWDTHIELGIKEKDGFRLPHSHISIANANKGTSKSSEKGAGLSPVGFVADEIGKWNAKGVLQSAIPSFQTEYGAKLVHLVCGTSGNSELTKEARDIITNPTAYSLLPMNWERLDRITDPEEITWKRSYKEKFATFIPGQMAYRNTGLKKVDSDLASYLKVDNPILEKIPVRVTNWKAANQLLSGNLSGLTKIEDQEKNRMYYPREVADVFITSATNPFPTSVIDAHIRMLEDTGRLGKNVELYRSGTELKSEFSAKKRAEVSHGGGEADAPVIVYGEIPLNPPPKFTFVSGLDDYKLEQSDTDSLGAFYVLKRRGLSFDSPCETIAASCEGEYELITDRGRWIIFNIKAFSI